MKNLKRVAPVKRVVKVSKYVPFRGLKFLLLFLVAGLVGFSGIKYTMSSFAATPNGTLDIVTYDGGNRTTTCSAAARAPMKRFSNSFFSTGIDHFYTMTNFANGTNGYALENGAAWYAYTYQAAGTVPFYRSWNGAANVQNHYYSTKLIDIQNAGYFGWALESIEGYISPSQVAGTVPLYHLYNAFINDHFYTTDGNEVNNARNLGFTYYANDPNTFVAGYVWTDSGSSCSTTSVYPGNEIGSVAVAIDQGGSGVFCSPSSGTTDPSSNANHGHLHLTCPAASNGGPRTYRLASAMRSGYVLSGSSPHKVGSTFTVSSGQNVTLSLVMDRSAGAPGPSPPPAPSSPSAPGGSSSGGGGSSSGSGSSGSGSSSSGSTSTSSQKNGNVQVTTYLYHHDGNRTRLGGINVHIQSIGYGTTDTAHGCDNYNTSTATSGSDEGQLQFNRCWTGSGGSKQYQLSYVQIPAGYSFSSFRLTSGGSFGGGITVNTAGVGSEFAVKSGQTTKLEIWLTKNGEGQEGLANLKQVVTQKGVRYTSGDNSPGKNKDPVHDALGGDSPDTDNTDPDGDGIDDPDGDTKAPSTPTGLKAAQDAAGNVILTWNASVGDPPGETITYYIYRGIIGSTDEPEYVDDVENITHDQDDAENIDYAQNYVYQVYAEDEDGNDSEWASVNITTAAPPTNVTPPADAGAPGDEAAPDDSAPDDSAQPDDGDPETETPDKTVIPSPSNDAKVTMPNSNAPPNGMACSVSESSSDGADLAGEYGDLASDIYTPGCSDDDGSSLDDFTDETEFSVDYDEDSGDYGDDVDLYGFDGTDWEEMSVDEAPVQADGSQVSKAKDSNLGYISLKKTKGKHKTTYTVKTKRLFAVALIHKKAPQKPIIPIFTLLAITAMLLFARRMMKRRVVEMVYESPYGNDPDIVAVVSRPEIPMTPEQQAVQPPAPPLLSEEAFMVHPEKEDGGKK